MYKVPIFTNIIWSYLLWSPVAVKIQPTPAAAVVASRGPQTHAAIIVSCFSVPSN